MYDIIHLWSQILFQHPRNLWYAIPGVAVVFAACYASFRWRVLSFRQYGDEKLVSRFSQAPTWSRDMVIAGLLSLAVISGTIAATMPYLPTAPVAVPTGSLHVVAAFDTSVSMASEDYRSVDQMLGGVDCSTVSGACGSRIDAAKLILRNQIMPQIKGNELGLVVYSGYGVVKSYLNDDFSPLTTMLGSWHWVDIGSAQGNGSYVDEGLNSALSVLERTHAKSGQPKATNVILLFTDGGHDGSQAKLDKAVGAINKAGVKLIIIGVGSTQPSVIPVYNDAGAQTGYFNGANGQPATSARDDAFMQQLAAQAGGQYIKSVPGQALNINWPNALAGSKVEIRKFNLYQYPLALALTLVGFVFLRDAVKRLIAWRSFSRRGA